MPRSVKIYFVYRRKTPDGKKKDHRGNLGIFYLFAVATGLFFVVRHVRALSVLFFVFTAVQFIAVGRARTMRYHLFVLHIVLRSASFHNVLFSKWEEKPYQFFFQR